MLSEPPLTEFSRSARSHEADHTDAKLAGATRGRATEQRPPYDSRNTLRVKHPAQPQRDD